MACAADDEAVAAVATQADGDCGNRAPLSSLECIDLVVTADDLGYSGRRDEGILKAFSEGIVTTASLMVNGKTAASAAKAAKACGLPIGLHLNITEGTPILSASLVPSLVVPLTLKDAVVSTDKEETLVFRGKLPTRTALDNGDIDLIELEKVLRN